MRQAYQTVDSHHTPDQPSLMDTKYWLQVFRELGVSKKSGPWFNYKVSGKKKKNTFEEDGLFKMLLSITAIVWPVLRKAYLN